MHKHNEKPIDMFNKQDVTVYLTYIKILKYYPIVLTLNAALPS